MNIIQIIKAVISKNILIYTNGSKISFSQEGEDVLLRNYFGKKEKGLFVDIGAFHPFIFSNTYIFYKSGWKGINIDPNPKTIELFNKYRPRDINIETAVGNRSGKMTYYMFNEGAVNTLDAKISTNNVKLGYKISDKKDVKVETLDKILSQYNPKKIDFMSIDVEGVELDVLKHNNWVKYRPTVILVEIFNVSSKEKLSREDMWISPEQLIENPIHKYLCKQGYRFVAKSISSAIYVDEKNKQK